MERPAWLLPAGPYDSRLTEAERRLINVARAFAHEVIAPNAAAWEAARTVPLDAVRTAADRGLCGLVVSAEHGGAGVGLTGFGRVMEELAAACLGFAFTLVVHNNLAGAISRNGSPAQIKRYLPDMLAGRRLGAFLLTEPGTGSDAAAIAARARRDGDGWVIDGEKAWATNAAAANLLSVYVQTEPAAGWRGIACFLIEGDAPGVERTPPYDLLGGNVMGTGGFRFAGCHAGGEAMLLPPGKAFKGAMAGINLARAGLAAMCCGMLRAGLDAALAYVSERRAFGQRVADFQGLQWQLAGVATDLEASRLLAYNAAAMADDGDARAVLAAAHAKKFAGDAAMRGLTACMQAMGATGYCADGLVARHFASAKMAQYLDGTSEIQNVVIARALLEPYRQENA